MYLICYFYYCINLSCLISYVGFINILKYANIQMWACKIIFSSFSSSALDSLWNRKMQQKKYIQKVTSCYIGAARKQGIQSYENLVIHSVVHYINPSNLSEYKNYNIVHNHQYQYIQYTQHRKIYFSVLSKPTPEINICIETIFVFISHFTSPLALDKRDWRVQLIL